MRNWDTLTNFVTYGKLAERITSVRFDGYTTVGDGGAAQWRRTGIVEGASQLPSQRGNGTLTDSSGAVWELVGNKANAKALGLTGVGDETSVLQAIANWLSPDKEVEFTDNFAITSTVTFSNGGTLHLNDTIIDGTGLPSNTADRTLNQALVFTGSLDASTVIAADISVGDDTFTATGAGLSVGDTVIVRSDQAFVDGWSGSVNNRRGEILTISDVSGDTYTVSERFKFSYLASSNLRVEKMNPTSPKIKGGLLQMGGVGSEHRGLQLIYARNAEIDGLIVKGAEDTSVSLQYCHTVKYKGECWDATTPLSGFNTGYGVSSINGSRNIDIDVVGYNCKHVVTAGGFLPSLETRIKGVAYDCGRTATAFDCHEPCYDWDWDVECYGGNAGIGLRGFEQKVKIKARNLSSNAVRVQSLDEVGEQYNIHVEVDSDGTGSSAVVFEAGTQNLRDVSVRGTIKNTALDAVTVTGNATYSISDVDIDIYAENVAERVVDARFASNVDAKVSSDSFGLNAVQLLNCSDSRLSLNVEAGASNAVFLQDCENVDISGDYCYGEAAVIRTDVCTDIRCSVSKIESVGASVDCWRATDTIGGKLIGSTLISGRHGVFSSGSSDKFVVSLNDATGVVNATKFNLSGANNIQINNLV